jgi:mannose-6-phosphate isomerase
MKLYPIKFTPLFYYRIWGGDKLKTVLNKNYHEDSIGESWEISDVEGCETIVANGDLKGHTLKELIKQFKGDFVGDQVYKKFKDNFPLLIKFIDSKTPLSIQVHPSNLLAKKRHNSFGKNEMWYIMDAEKEAELIVGFNKDVEKEKYIEHLNSSTLNEILNIEKIKKGDTFYIPTGRVHAIGAGVLLAEIQQTSDITYRIYDYDRIDIKTEQKRELHTDLALDAIDFKYYDNYKTKYENKENTSNKLVYSQYFRTNIINISSAIKKDYSNIDSFVIYMCVSGSLSIEHKSNIYNLKTGETVLLPAVIKQVKIKSKDAKVLEIFI